MKKITAALLAALLLPQAYALDQSAAVKASTVLKTQNSWDGKALAYPQGQAQVTGMLIEIAPGGETGWHLHTVPSFAMVTEGDLEVHLKDGSVKRLKAGDMLAEVVNTLHNGRNVGAGPVKLVVVYTGVADSKLTVMEAAKP
ncbi:cupin domain-containing protein [Duganella sp. FT92W]|uniref:Cupin domain-containing protein n=1 Tax=Pseudoduganella rivuli TaxID=2666085 RepID=A0A7X2LVP4_9BURK|nr:cupin domain-containing protein [Pseudoduganella rivuli]MRV75228.1 cupin domain-containing protein [Pseudoduganella rivuli]